ncbi:hypothetical protein ACQPZQ_07670 [Pseudonocardia sp. CA-142604]|uniref:hypothetical protein n=1 Tax=Pseudonocardia sp. CA-142604 TaxID=3240024 RepID=UPI003D945398
MNDPTEPLTTEPLTTEPLTAGMPGEVAAGVYLPDGCGGPGVYREVGLEVVAVRAAGLVLPEVTVLDERGGELFTGGSLVCDPAGGGGPLAGAGAARSARAFGVVHTGFHVQRALRWWGRVLGRRLPPLVVRIGLHEHPRRWGGGHYRLPGGGAQADPDALTPTGEIHLGGGAGFVAIPQTGRTTTDAGGGGGRYFHAPAHNTAIIYHEVGHHVCRHTADFRLNRLRPPWAQTNKKTALDEGTADVLTAILLNTPDIYGWHRGDIPTNDQRRRRLDPRWTMAHFHGGAGQDPHADGTVWASACWSARHHLITTGTDPARFDTLLLRGLDHTGTDTTGGLTDDTLRKRRHFSRLLTAMTHADPDLAPHLLTAMAHHGIHPGLSNHDLSQAARADHNRLVRA